MWNICYITVPKFWTQNRYQWKVNLAVTNGIQINQPICRGKRPVSSAIRIRGLEVKNWQCFGRSVETCFFNEHNTLCFFSLPEAHTQNLYMLHLTAHSTEVLSRIQLTTRRHITTLRNPLNRVSQPLWDRGPVNSFFIRRRPGPNKFTGK